MVEVTGFEPTASWSRTKRSTKLSHTSDLDIIASFGIIVNKIIKIFLVFYPLISKSFGSVVSENYSTIKKAVT